MKQLLQQILEGALIVKVATESLHPMYERCPPEDTATGLCVSPGIAVPADQTLLSVRGLNFPAEKVIIKEAELDSGLLND